MYDLVIKGGRVIDPAQNIDDKVDVAVSGGKIAAIGKDVSKDKAKQVVDAKGKIVTPGIIDLHAHVAGDLLTMSIDPDDAGVNQGVTTVVDGGSVGEALFPGFPRYVVPSSKTRVFVYLHLSSQGLSVMPELRDSSEINLELTAKTLNEYRGLIKGVKVRLLGNLFVSEGAKIVEMAKKVAGGCGMPIMVHLGDYFSRVSPSLTRETLSLMEKGDILSHVYTAKFGSVIQADGTLLPELKQAQKRGVILDVAMGKSNFNFEVARRCLAQGAVADTLSTDVGDVNLRNLVFGMTVTMSKFLGLGMDLKQIIEKSTINPARALGEDKLIGSLKPGMEADISILEILTGKWRLEDSEQKTLDVDKLISPVTTIRAGEVIPAQPVAQPKNLA